MPRRTISSPSAPRFVDLKSFCHRSSHYCLELQDLLITRFNFTNLRLDHFDKIYRAHFLSQTL
ncbi:hypothetical protein SLEP1_g53455 [Rubroshorea leprosula]|uniref:Uncharacterized protein n=1 Tax=Rubroshorea leprosula TaxID=152421 RepID=A0AAV5M9S9_9ROSI|nr:hypothetical protein SLEP1_g53455 [Rubroshorea leprosula]